MSKLIGKTEFEHVITETWKKAKSKFAKLDEENVFTKKNSFNSSLQIGKGNDYYVKIGNGTGSDKLQSDNVSGNREKHSHYDGNDGYVSLLEIRIIDEKNIGDNVLLSVYEVKKNATTEQDQITEVIINKSNVKVEKGREFPKALIIPIEKKYEDETYFLIHSHINDYISNTNVGGSGNLHKNGITNVMSKGQTLGGGWNSSWVVDYVLYNGYNIVDKIDSIRALANKPSGAGTLNTINDEAGENGNVNLTLELTTDKLKLNVHGTEKSSINVATQADIDNMFTNLQ